MEEPTTDQVTRRSQQAARTRSRIADAALRLFSENGFGSTSTRLVAEEAGVSEGLVFRYFPTKRALLEGAMATRPTFAGQFDALLGEATDLPVEVALPKLLDGFVELVGAESRTLTTMVAESRTDDELHDLFTTTFRHSLGKLAAYLDRRVEVGDLRSDLDTDVAAQALVGPLLLFFLVNDRLAVEEWRDRASRFATVLLDSWLRGATDSASGHRTRDDATDAR